MSLLVVLPLAVVMVAGPQFLSAIFLATTERWRENSAAYILGAAASISLAVYFAFALGLGAIEQGQSRRTLKLVILAILLVAMAHTYLTREQSEPPKWMGRLQAATPRFSLRLGFLLLGAFPTDIITSLTVGSYFAANDIPLTHAIPFVLATLTLLALPALAVLVLGSRAEAALPRIRKWMNANAWLVNEAVLLFFVAMLLNGLR